MTIRLGLIVTSCIFYCSALFAEEIWHKDILCEMVQIPGSESEIPGCLSAICAAYSDASKICKCRTDIESTECLLYSMNGSSIKQLATIPNWPTMDSAFLVSTADVDSDRQQEIIIATMEVIGNGLGIQAWSVYVLKNEVLSEPMYVCDYPVLSYWVKETGTQQCFFLSARWEEGAEAVRGGGLYLWGSWYRYANMHFEPIVERQVVRRRYLYRFEKERSDAMSQNPPKPLLWFKDASVQVMSSIFPFDQKE